MLNHGESGLSNLPNRGMTGLPRGEGILRIVARTSRVAFGRRAWIGRA